VSAPVCYRCKRRRRLVQHGPRLLCADCSYETDHRGTRGTSVGKSFSPAAERQLEADFQQALELDDARDDRLGIPRGDETVTLDSVIQERVTSGTWPYPGGSGRPGWRDQAMQDYAEGRIDFTEYQRRRRNEWFTRHPESEALR
jgi:hypothetical protein